MSSKAPPPVVYEGGQARQVSNNSPAKKPSPSPSNSNTKKKKEEEDQTVGAIALVVLGSSAIAFSIASIKRTV